MAKPQFSTTDLIPTSGVHVTETFYPKGFQVASHDRGGFANDLRWFPTRTAAETYARILQAR